MFCKFSVPIAAVPGKTVILKKQGAKYHYVLLEISRKYDDKKKFTSAKRILIGRVCEEDESLMHPNDEFLKRFPEFKVPEDYDNSPRSCCLQIGTYIVIKKIIEERQLDEIVKKRFGDDAGLFCDLASYFIVDEDNAGQYYPDYAFKHPLFSKEMRICSDSKVSRAYKNCTKDQIIAFLDDWNKKKDHRQRIYISYDSTNKNCQAGDIDILEYGHAKDDRNIPIYNIAIAFDKNNKEPLFYEEYPGSICDVAQLKYLIDKVKAYNYKHIGFVLDRGYFSKDNIRYMDANGYQFIIMVKGCKRLVSSFIMENEGSFEADRDFHIPATPIYGKTIEAPLYSGDKIRYFHLYYNPQKNARERLKLESKIDTMKAALDEMIGKKLSNKDLFDKYFSLTLNDDNILITFEERKDVTSAELKQCGHFCIVSSEKMDATEAYFLYKGRDPSEKLFRADKTFLGSRSPRVQSKESLSTKNWLEFFALIIRNRMFNLLKDEMVRLQMKKNFLTVPAAIKELEKIEMVRINDGTYQLDHALTKTQKIILQAFGIDAEDIKAEAKLIADTLAATEKSETIESEDDDAEDEIDEEFGEEDFEGEY